MPCGMPPFRGMSRESAAPPGRAGGNFLWRVAPADSTIVVIEMQGSRLRRNWPPARRPGNTRRQGRGVGGYRGYLLAGCAAGALAIGTPASAATLLVTSNADTSAAGTLRNALASASDGDTISFSLPAGRTTITLGSELPLVTKSITINGANAGGAVAIDGGHTTGTTGVRVLFVDAPGKTVSIENVTLQNGFAKGVDGGSGTLGGGGGLGAGGALFAYQGNVRLS